MSDAADTDPIPPYAVTMWEGERDIFCALPLTAGGIPYIMRFPRNEGGLSSALAVLSRRKREVLAPTLDAPANYAPPTHQPMVKLGKRQEQLYAETTEAQREAARKLVAKLGIK